MVKLSDLLIEEIRNNKIICDNCKHSWFKSEAGDDMYMCHICGHDNEPNTELIEFAKKRLEGATKITNNAKEKGGPAMLTYHHFVVKLPYYEKASKGEFNLQEAKNELRGYMEELCGGQVKMDQIGFQRLVGLIEVLGELVIKHNEIK